MDRAGGIVRCDRCLGRHDTNSHDLLERTYQRFERWGIGLEIPKDSASPGAPGAPSPSEISLVPPDLLRIVRCSIGGVGWEAENSPGPAILRLWKQDAAGGFTFMLSCDRLLDGEVESLVALCGDLGSTAMVDVRFSRTTQNSERFTTSPNTW